MKFEDILDFYECNLFNIKQFKERKFYSDDYIEGMLRQNLKWFRVMASQCPSRYKEVSVRKGAKVEEYRFENQLPFKFIVYRGEKIPVYDDDYGQQDFAVIRGQVVSGGAYNFMSAEEFVYYMDEVLEREFLEKGDEESCHVDG